MSKIFLGSDHAAFAEKEQLRDYLKEKGLEVVDLGPETGDRCNYPDFASAVAKETVKNNARGILLCGSGIGVSMVANRYKGARAALCRSANDAALSRQHNNANILCVGARVSSMDEIKEITNSWLKSEFEQGRHTERVALFNDLGEDV